MKWGKGRNKTQKKHTQRWTNPRTRVFGIATGWIFGENVVLLLQFYSSARYAFEFDPYQIWSALDSNANLLWRLSLVAMVDLWAHASRRKRGEVIGDGGRQFLTFALAISIGLGLVGTLRHFVSLWVALAVKVALGFVLGSITQRFYAAE